MKKLDDLLRFRDNERFKVFAKVFSIVVVGLALALLGLIIYCGATKEGKNFTRPYVFSLLCIILLASFLKKNDYLFLLAEFVTIIADIFLILLGKINIGFPIYLIVQLIYALYFYCRDPYKRRELVITIIRGVVILLGIIGIIALAALHKTSDIRLVVGVMYFANILINIICAIMLKDPILIIGFIFFAVSDTFIGLSLFKINFEGFNFVYFNYVISQVILMFNKHNNSYIKEINSK